MKSNLDIRYKDGVLFLPVRVQPKASAEGVVGEHGGALKVKVTEPPEKGKANKALKKLLADKLGIPPSSVELVRGETSRDKLFAIKGIGKDELLKALGG